MWPCRSYAYFIFSRFDVTNAKVIDLEEKSIFCQKMNHWVFFPQKLIQHDALQLCNVHGGNYFLDIFVTS